MKKYVEWNCALDLIYKLIEDKNYRMAMFILISIHTGLKVNQIRKLKWINILNEYEIKDNNILLNVNDDFYNVSNYIYKQMGEPQKTEYILLSNKKCPYSVQRLNILLKDLNRQYKLGVKDLTTHSLRKTFGRRIVEQSQNQNATLFSLSTYFGHASPRITIDYLGLDYLKEKHFFEIGVKNDGYFSYLKEKVNIRNNNLDDAGYVYIMKDLNYPDVVKIGKSKTPSIREQTLGHQIPSIQLYKVVKTKKMRELENIIHTQYKDKRKRGEWFELNENDIKQICREYDFVDF